MFLSSWLESFKETIQLSPRVTRRKPRQHGHVRRPQMVEMLENRLVLASSFQFPAIGPNSPVEISHSSTIAGEPNSSSVVNVDRPLNLDPSEIKLTYSLGVQSVTAFSNDIHIVQPLGDPASIPDPRPNPDPNKPALEVYRDSATNVSYIRFSPGSARFGSTTITVTDSNNNTMDIPIHLNDVPSFDPIANRSVPEANITQEFVIPLSGITAGGGADDPFNNGQQRLMYASTSNPQLSGVPKIDYVQSSMNDYGTLKLLPARGAPLTVANSGDNEATITVTIEDAGADNLLGRRYDPRSGTTKIDITTGGAAATIDNIIRSRTFKFSVIPVNNPPTITDILTATTTLTAINQSTDLTLNVADASHFPISATPPFTILVQNERMLVTNVVGTTFTVTRGVEGTAVVAHPVNGVVTLLNELVLEEDDLDGPTTVQVVGVTPGGGISPLGNEVQQVQIDPLTTPPLLIKDGYYTLTFDNLSKAFTTDLIPFNAPATISLNEASTVRANANGGTFRLVMADNVAAVTSLNNGHIPSFVLDATMTTLFVDNISDSFSSFPVSAPGTPQIPFVIAIDGEEMKVTSATPDPTSENSDRYKFSVVRGYHGTTPAVHGDDASVIEVKTTRLQQPSGIGTLFAGTLSAAINNDPMSNPTKTFDVNSVNGYPTIATNNLKNQVSFGDLTVALNDVSSFPAAPFKIQIDNEVMLVTLVDSPNNQFTVRRAQDQTSLALHPANAPVVQPFTIRVDQEEMRVTSVSGRTLTVVRGVNGTTKAAHGRVLAYHVDDVITVQDYNQLPSTTPFEIRVEDTPLDEDLRVIDVVPDPIDATNPLGLRAKLFVIRGIHGTSIGVHADGQQVTRLQTTPGIQSDADATAVNFALSLLPIVGSSGAQVSGTGPITQNNKVTVEFLDTLGRLNLDDMTKDDTGLNGDQTVRINFPMWPNSSNFSGSGAFMFLANLGGGATETVDIPYNADRLQVQQLLEGLQSINEGDVIVTGGALPLNPSAIFVEFTGQYANQDVTSKFRITPDPNPSQRLFNNERQLITFDPTATGGTFQLTFTDTTSTPAVTRNTADITYDPSNRSLTESNIANALRSTGLPLLQSVSVVRSSSFPNQYVVTFLGLAADLNVTQINITPTNLSATPPIKGNQLTPLVPSRSLQSSTLEEGDQQVSMTSTVSAITSPFAEVLTFQDGALSVFDALSELPSMDVASLKIISGGPLPNSPIGVEFTGQYGGLDFNRMGVRNDPLPNRGLIDFFNQAVVTELARKFDGEEQDLTLQAISSDVRLVPHPVVAYVSPTKAGTLTITNNTDQFGITVVTVTVIDAGIDGRLETAGDNGRTTRELRVRVNPTNDQPTIDPLPDLAIPKNSSSRTILLNGITSGGSEDQALTITATSSNLTLLPNPSVSYVNGSSTAQMKLVPAPGQVGTAVVSVTVEDAGTDGILNTASGNGKRIVKFRFDVSEDPVLGITPTLIVIPEDSTVAPNQPLLLGGITTGESDPLLPQELSLSLSNLNTGLFVSPTKLNLNPNPAIFPGVAGTVYSATLNFMPTSQLSGLDTFRLTLADGGRDHRLGTPSSLSVDVSATATTITVPDSAIYSAPGLPSDQLAAAVTFNDFLTAPMNVSDTSLVVSSPNQFPAVAPFNITVDEEAMTVTAVSAVASGIRFMVTRPSPQTHDRGATVVSPTATTITLVDMTPFSTLTVPFKIQIGSEMMTVTSMNVPTKSFTVERGTDGTKVARHVIDDPVVSPFKIQVGNELMRVIKLTGNILTVVRGIDGTTAVGHLAQDVVVHPFSLDNLTITRDISVVVNPVNDLPTLDPIAPNPLAPGFLTIPEGSGQQIISLSGITDGEGAGARQHLRVDVSSSNPALTGPITVSYTDGDPSGSIRFTPTANVSGSAGITVTVYDGGSDNDLNTLEANFSDKVSRTLNLTVVAIGDAPTINTIASRTFNEDAPLQTVALSGISDGDANTQDLMVSVSTTDALLTTNLTLNYNPTNLQPTTGGTPPSTGSLTFVPGANEYGSASITVTVTDGGADARLGIDLLTNLLSASLLSNSVMVANATRFPASAGFNIVIGNEEMTVTAITPGPGAGATFTVTRAVNSTPLQVHTIGSLVSAPNTVADNVSTSRTFNVTVNSVNDAPTITTINGTSVVAVNQVTLPAILEDAPLQTINLAGIGPGPFESQDVSVSVTSSNTDLIVPSVSYVNGSSTGTITFQPAANKFGTATLTVKISDAGPDGNLLTPSDNAVTTRTIVVNVSAVNDAPTIAPIVLGGSQLSSPVTSLTATTISVLSSFLFPASGTPNFTIQIDNEQMTVTGVSGTTFTVVRQANGTSAATHAAQAQVRQVVPEDSGENSVRLISITAGPLESQILKATPLVLSSSVPGLIANAAVDYTSPNSTGTLRFTPGANLFGMATIRVAVEDAGFDGVLGTSGFLTADIGAFANGPLTLVSTVGFPTTATPNFSINIGGEVMTVTAVAGNTFTVTRSSPVAHLRGDVVELQGAAFDNATFFRDFVVNVNNINDLPTLTQPPAATINKNGYVINSVTLNGISDADLNTQTLTVTATSDNPGLVPNPTVNFTQSGVSPSTALQTATLVFNPAANQLGTANITVKVEDGFNSFVTKTFVLTVADVNLPPTIDPLTDITGLTEPAATQFVTLSGITAGGVESQALTVTATSSNTAAIPTPSVTYTSPSTSGMLSFTPTPDAVGTFTITVTVTDAGGAFTNTTFNVTIDPGNDDPPTIATINNVVVAISGSPTAQTVDLSGVAAGPFETGPVGISVMSSNTALIPTPTVNYTSPNTIGSLSFTPAASMFGSSLITVTVSDGGADNNVATAGDNNTTVKTFTIYVVNPPTINPISNPAAVDEDSGVQSVILANVTDGDGGFEGGTVTVSSNNPSLFATLTVTPNDLSSPTPTVNYTFNPDANGTATVTVTVTDDGPDFVPSTGDEKSVSQSFTVVVTPVNDAPTFTLAANPPAVNEDSGTQSVPNFVTNLSVGPANEASQFLTGSAVTQTGSTGGLTFAVAPTINPVTGTLSYRAAVDSSGTGTFNVTLSDSGSNTAPNVNTSIAHTFTITVNPVNDAPTLNTISDVTVNEDSGLGSVSLSNITAGAGESQGLTVTATSDNQDLIPDANLTVIYTSASPTGMLQFTPTANKNGDAFITVTVTDDNSIDGVAKSFSKTFKVHVNSVNDAPEIFGLLETADSTVSVDGTTAFIDENLPLGTEVAVVDFDDEGPLSVLNVSIISGNTNNAFSIGPDGTIRVANASAMNFEVNPVFTLTVKIIDNSPTQPTGLSAQQTFTIRLNDLSEVLTIGQGNWPTTGGLTLKRTGDGLVHVLNSSNADVVPAHDFAHVSQIQVTGRSGVADVLTLDYAGGLDPIPTGMAEGLTFNGGTGLGDTIKFANATFGQLDTTFGTNPTSAVIDDLAAAISLTGIEAITFNSSVSATNLNFVYGPGNDTVTFADDSNSSNGVSTFSASTSPLVTFPALAGVTVNVGDGNNSVTFNSIENAGGPAVTVLAGDGNDSLRASSVGRAVSLSSGGGNDTLGGGSGNDTLDAGDGDDTISGGFGNDQIFGGDGTNTLYESADASYSVGNGTTSGGLGSDTFSDIAFAFLVGGAGNNTISAAGFGGQATINGSGGNDNLTGSSNNDVLTGGDGNDAIDGGGGDDTLVESGNVNFVLGASTMTGLGSDTISNIAFAVLTGGSGNNTLDASGFDGSVTLKGGAGNDILKGGAGNDSLSGDAGNDTLSGNGGTNTLNGGTEIDQVLESGDMDFTLLAAQLISGLGTDDLIAIETAKLVGGVGNNTLNASAYSGKAMLQGGDGADTLIGSSNADNLDGGNGNDVLTGGLGNDTFAGGAGTDTILETGVTKLSLTATAMTGLGTDALSSMELASLTGTAGNDTITGGTYAGAMIINGLGGTDSLMGGNGSDTIYGGAGNDILSGGLGNDLIRGEADNDRILGGAGHDSLDGGAGNDSIFGEAGNDVILGGDGNDSLSGGNDNDAIDGQGGDDKVLGDNGNNTLIGGTGKDSIVGGTGSDKLFGGDYHANPTNPSDGAIDTLISGSGADTVKGETGLDVMTDLSNTAAEKAAAFVIDYDSIFGALLGP